MLFFYNTTIIRRLGLNLNSDYEVFTIKNNNFNDTFQWAKSQSLMRRAYSCVKKGYLCSPLFLQMSEKRSWFSMFLKQPEICWRKQKYSHCVPVYKWVLNNICLWKISKYLTIIHVGLQKWSINHDINQDIKSHNFFYISFSTSELGFSNNWSIWL